MLSNKRCSLFSHLFTVLPDAADERQKNTGLGAFFDLLTYNTPHNTQKEVLHLHHFDANEQDSSSPPKRRVES
jgi:hypothetical protein